MVDYSHLTDEELVQKSLNDMGAFALLIDRFEGKLKNYILRISSFSVEEAEEILQEVFLKGWKNLNDFTGEVKFSSWLYRIAHNETISHFRKSKSRGEDKKQHLDEELFQIPDKTDLAKELDAKFTAESIQETLVHMNEKYREVLVLKFLEEKSYEEIADILKKPMGTVATLVNRAKKSFRDAAAQHNISFSL